MSEITKETKRKIAEEWMIAIPQLSEFAQNKFYRVVGCCIIGIELIKLPKVQDYRPHFVLYPLWKNDVKDCLDSPVLLTEVSNRKGLQFSIPYLKHGIYFDEAIECLKKQIPLLTDENISLKSLFELIDSRFTDILIKSNSAQQAKLLECKFHIALYTGDQQSIKHVLSQIQQIRDTWNMQMFETWYGKFDLWFQNLNEKINKRDAFLKQIESIRMDKKIQQLKSSEIL